MEVLMSKGLWVRVKISLPYEVYCGWGSPLSILSTEVEDWGQEYILFKHYSTVG